MNLVTQKEKDEGLRLTMYNDNKKRGINMEEEKSVKQIIIYIGIIGLSIVFAVIFIIAVYFQIKELYPIVGPFAGVVCYWLIRLYQHIYKN